MDEIDEELPRRLLPITNIFPPMPSHNNSHFRFLFTLITKIITDTSFGQNLFSTNEMQLSYYKNFQQQLIFLKKFLELLSVVKLDKTMNHQTTAEELIDPKTNRDHICAFIEYLCSFLKDFKQDTTIQEELIREKYKLDNTIQSEKSNLALMFNMLKHISQPTYANIHAMYPKLKAQSNVQMRKTIVKSALRNLNSDEVDGFFKVVEVNRDNNEIIISKICSQDSDKLNDIDYIFECKQ